MSLNNKEIQLEDVIQIIKENLTAEARLHLLRTEQVCILC